MNPLFLSAVSLRQSIYVNICQRTVCPIDVIVLILSIYGYITYKENPKKLQASSNATPLQFWIFNNWDLLKGLGKFPKKTGASLREAA